MWALQSLCALGGHGKGNNTPLVIFFLSRFLFNEPIGGEMDYYSY